MAALPQTPSPSTRIQFDRKREDVFREGSMDSLGMAGLIVPLCPIARQKLLGERGMDMNGSHSVGQRRKKDADTIQTPVF